jgi:hypothetical protein
VPIAHRNSASCNLIEKKKKKKKNSSGIAAKINWREEPKPKDDKKNQFILANCLTYIQQEDEKSFPDRQENGICPAIDHCS